MYRSLLVLFIAFTFLSCTSAPTSVAVDQWKRVGDKVHFQNTSAEDHGRDFWAWDGKPLGIGYSTVNLNVKKSSGSLHAGFGILYGYKDDRNYVRILISCSQDICIYEFRDSKESVIVAWQKLSVLKPGLDTVNTIQLIAGNHNEIQLVVNGQNAGKFASNTKFEGKLGCFAAVGDDELVPGQVQIDYELLDYVINPLQIKDLPQKGSNS